MTALLLLLGASFLALRRKARSHYFRAYGVLFLVLLIFASNKAAFGLPYTWWANTFSPLSNLRWMLLAVVSIFAVVSAPRVRAIRRNPVWIPLGGLALLMFASTLYSPDPGYTFLRAMSVSLLVFGLTWGLSQYLVLWRHCLEHIELQYWFAWLALFPLFALYLIGLQPHPVMDHLGRFQGIFGNVNTLGAFAALVAPLSIHQWQVGRTRLNRRIALMFLVGLVMMIWFSGSRGALLAFVAGAGTYFLVVESRKRWATAAVSLAIGIAVLAFPTVSSGTRTFFQKGGQVTRIEEERRYEMWSGVMPAFMESKWTGYGFGAAKREVFAYTTDEEAGRAIHNSYLEMFGDLGLPGLALLLWALGIIVAQALGLARRGGTPFERNLAATYVAMVAAGSVNAVVESWMFSVGNVLSMMFWASATGIVARWSAAAPRRSLASVQVKPLGVNQAEQVDALSAWQRQSAPGRSIRHGS